MRLWDTGMNWNIARKWERGSPRNGRRRSNGSAALLSREALTRALWRQRAYADRTGAAFVFVRIRTSAPGRDLRNDVCRDRLACAVCGLCRAGDAAGWYGESGSDVGIILPDATPRGALRVVREFEAVARAEAEEGAGGIPEIACELFVYPGTGFSSAVDWPLRDFETERA